MYPRLLKPPSRQSFFLFLVGLGRQLLRDEVDFVLYGERGIRAIEVKMAHNVRPADLGSLLRFRMDFPQAKTALVYLGRKRSFDRGVEVVPVHGLHFGTRSMVVVLGSSCSDCH